MRLKRTIMVFHDLCHEIEGIRKELESLERYSDNLLKNVVQ